MKPITIEILDQMFARAEERMLNDGWKDYEISSFMTDPIVRLFYGACAEEIGKVHEEIYHVEQRLIHKTIEQLLPEEFHLPSPSHAIFHAQPLTKLSTTEIGPDFQFKLFKPPLNKELVFTPAGNFTVNQADITHIVFRDQMFQLDYGKKIPLMSAQSAKTVQDDILWLGFKDLNELLPRDKFHIYFSLPQSFNEQYGFLNAIKYAKCTAENGQTVRTDSGLDYDDIDYRVKLIKQPDYLIFKMFQNVRNWYQKDFLTLYDLPPKSEDSPAFPAELQQLFSAADLAKVKDNVYWIKFSFSNLLKESWIQQLYCSINCFPALNLKIEQDIFDAENIPVNIYSISSSDVILSIKNITGKLRLKQEEIEYKMVDPSVRNAVGREGEAIFRKGSLGRLNAQKLKSMLNLLTNLLKEETILLTRDGTKEDLDKLSRLSRAAADFEKSLEIEKEKKGRFSGSVILRPYKDQSKIYIRFWTTAGEEGNTLRPLIGEDAARQCEIAFAPDISSSSIRLLNTTSGGKKQPSDEEYIDTLRKLLLTRGRIVTAEDVKAFCYEHFSPNKITVDVNKCISPSTTPGHGLVRMIDVHIKFTEKNDFSAEELLNFKEELLQKLEQHASNVMPFRVVIS